MCAFKCLKKGLACSLIQNKIFLRIRKAIDTFLRNRDLICFEVREKSLQEITCMIIEVYLLSSLEHNINIVDTMPETESVNKYPD